MLDLGVEFMADVLQRGDKGGQKRLVSCETEFESLIASIEELEMPRDTDVPARGGVDRKVIPLVWMPKMCCA